MANTEKVVTEIQSFSGNTNERNRAVYLLVFLQTASDAMARKVSGLGQHAQSRLIQMLMERGSILDAPRSGRPREWTEDKLAKALDILKEEDRVFLTGRALLQIMVDKGYTEPSADVDHFMRRFREYVKSLGHKLTVNSTRTIFFLAVGDVIKRVKYASSMQVQLQHSPLEMVIFADETTLEESPHPKGVSKGAAGSRQL
jgi:transposase